MNSNLEAQGLRLVSNHIYLVQKWMAQFIDRMMFRLIEHDQSKFSDDEIDLVTGKPLLDSLGYMSDEYTRAIGNVGKAVISHHKSNSHHPEHFSNGIESMSLLDLMEMLCDWKVAGEAKGSNIWESIEVNTDRYNIPPSIVDILKNTAIEMGWRSWKQDDLH